MSSYNQQYSWKVAALLGLWMAAASAFSAPSFVDITGSPVNLDSYRGKWIIVNYWATWCPPCKAEIPELIHFHEAHKDKDAVVVGFSMDEISTATLSRFVEENMMSYPIVQVGEDTPLVGDLPGLPTTYMIDPEGNTVARRVGQVSIDMLESFINKNSK